MPEMGREISEELASVVDEETKRIIDECYAVAQETLQRERARLEALAEALLQRESLDEKEILQVTGLSRAPNVEALLTPPDRSDTAPVEPARSPLAPDPTFAPPTNGAAPANGVATGSDATGVNAASHEPAA